jgi:hypothetical protein
VVGINFDNFKLAYIGFLPGSENSKVIAYSDKNFKGEKIAEYTIKGKLKNDGSIEFSSSSSAVGSSPIIKTIMIEQLVFEEEVEYIDIEKPGCPALGKKTESKPHPPLSFEIKDVVPGVYFYTDKLGEEIYLTADIDFTKTNTKFNDKVTKITINNKGGGSAEHDYIAITHENDNYTGKMKMFFEKKGRELIPGKPITTLTAGILGPERVSVEKNDTKPLFGAFDYYGQAKEKEISSVTIKELASANPEVCKRVWLCTGEQYGGECLVYVYGDDKIPEDKYKEGRWISLAHSIRGATTSMPIYSAKNIAAATPDVYQIDKNGNTISKKFDENDYNDNINSIWIEGDCMVALFENKVGESNFPGSRSQIFFESQKSLKSYQIHTCSPILGLNFFVAKSCVSAIAIYPIKK